MLLLEVVCDTALVSNISQSCVRLDAKIAEDPLSHHSVTVRLHFVLSFFVIA